MEDKESLNEMNMGKLWALARSRGIEFKGKTKKELIKELIASDAPKTEEVKKETLKVEEKKIEKNPTLVEVTLADGTKAKIPAKDVQPIKAKAGDMIIIKSVDGRELEVSVGRDHWIGKEIEVPAEQEEEVKRLLKDGGFYFV